jgi:hypothetical protein
MSRLAFGRVRTAAVLALVPTLAALAAVVPSGAELARAAPRVRALAVTPEQQHNLDVINGYRAQARVPPLQLDPQVSDFALAGSQELMVDHVFHKHDIDNGDGQGHGRYWEIQGANNGRPIVGWPSAPSVNATVDRILADMMAEPFAPPPGTYNHHSIVIDPGHTVVGVGLVIDGVNGTLYLTNDFNRQ